MYFATPGAHSVGVGRVGREQMDDYAARMGVPLTDLERMMPSNLAY